MALYEKNTDIERVRLFFYLISRSLNVFEDFCVQHPRG